MSPAVIPIHFISAVVILLASLVVIVQFSLTYNESRRSGAFYNFIVFFFRFLWSKHLKVFPI